MTGIMGSYAFQPDGSYDQTIIEGTEDFVSVAEIGEWGYSWHLLYAWYSPSRARFYWIAGSGCSCNSLDEDMRTLSDFQDGDRDALVAAIKAEFADGYELAGEALDKEIRAVRTWQYEEAAK